MAHNQNDGGSIPPPAIKNGFTMKRHVSLEKSTLKSGMGKTSYFVDRVEHVSTVLNRSYGNLNMLSCLFIL